jgi:hypothetical protein
VNLNAVGGGPWGTKSPTKLKRFSTLFIDSSATNNTHRQHEFHSKNVQHFIIIIIIIIIREWNQFHQIREVEFAL